MNYLNPEIKINERYAGLLMSEFEEDNLEKNSQEIISKKIISTQLYCEKLGSLFTNQKNVLLPANCRYLESYDNGYIVVVEEPPAYRTISIEYNINPEINRLRERGLDKQYDLKRYYGQDRYTFNLAFPYVIFILNIGKNFSLTHGEIFFRNKQLIGFGDHLFIAPLYNINNNQSICFGSGTYDMRPQSLIDAINKYLMLFWSSSFNPDYRYNYDMYRNIPILNSYIEWEYYSKTDPMFIFKAEWKPTSENLGIRIERVKTVTNVNKKQKLDYTALSQLFFTATEVKENKLKETKSLYYDVTQAILLTDDPPLELSVGDEFPYKSKDHGFIESFVSSYDSYEPDYIQILRKNKRFLLKITNKVFQYLKNYITDKTRIQSLKIGKYTIKPSDIISFTSSNNNKLYRQVNYIRRSLIDGKVEINLGGDYYFADSLKNLELFNMDEGVINNLKLEKGKNYLCINMSDHYSNIFSRSYELSYHGPSVDKYNSLSLFFNSRETGSFYIPFTYLQNYKVIEVSSLKQPSGLFRIGRIIGNFSSPVHIDEHGIFSSAKYSSPFSRDNLYSKETEQLLHDDAFVLPGFDFTTTFQIGDQVVSANWNDPLDMLKVKTIESFVHDKKDGNIKFILKDNESNLQSIDYVSEVKHRTVYTGRIRRITTKLGDLERGDKIVANISSIQCFPKKDVNIIAAIIIDEGLPEPLILCSNCCTLWYSDVIKMFTVIKKKNKKWKTMTLTPVDMSKIKPQAGDVLLSTDTNWSGTSSTFFLHSGYYNNTPTLKYTDLSSLVFHRDNIFSFDKSIARRSRYDTILSPRILISRIMQLGFFEGYPNLHGGTPISKGRRTGYNFYNLSSPIIIEGSENV